MVNFSKDVADQYATVDYNNTFAVVAIYGEGPEEKIIGVGRYWRHPDPRYNKAEMAIVVEDAYQKIGIGTHLSRTVGHCAQEHGIDTVEMEMLKENEAITKMIQQSGLELVGKLERDSSMERDLQHYSDSFYRKQILEREKISSVASISRFIKPKSIAVLGASNKPGIGNAFVRNLIKYGYTWRRISHQSKARMFHQLKHIPPSWMCRVKSTSRYWSSPRKNTAAG